MAPVSPCVSSRKRSEIRCMFSFHDIFHITYHSGSFGLQEQSDRDEQQNHCSSILPSLYAPQSVLQTVDSLWQSLPSMSDLGSRVHWCYCACSMEVWVVGWWDSGRSILIPVWSLGRGWFHPSLHDTLGCLKRENVNLNSVSLAIHSVIVIKDANVWSASASAWSLFLSRSLNTISRYQMIPTGVKIFPFPQRTFCLWRSLIALTFSTSLHSQQYQISISMISKCY